MVERSTARDEARHSPNQATGAPPGGRGPGSGPGNGTSPPPSAVLDTAHVGDIEGALGRVSVGEIGERTSMRQRLLTLLAIVGPGIIVMVGDNDAGGVSTYAQAGQDFH